MNINWKLKSKIFSFISFFQLDNLLYFIQKNITKKSRIEINCIIDDWIYHQENLISMKSPSIIEFGAGKNLSQNIFLSNFFSKQTLVDLNTMIDFQLVNSAIEKIANLDKSFKNIKIKNLSDLSKYYNIEYIAPLNLITTKNFNSDQFDGCISTNTLEHIPNDQLYEIFYKLKIIIKNEGIVSAVIDYSDHYSHTDRQIGPLNFLQYSTNEFKKYNHNNHFQNRMRHNDYKKIFQELGYEIIKQIPLNYASTDIKMSKEFDKNDKDTYATKGIYLLKNRK
tara:strand:- start:1909 stop:2748 length:840 start_codon:yes stop_codon:yes gene_type:complete